MKKNIIVLFVVFITLSCTKVSTSPDDNLAAPSNLILEQIDLESIQLTWQNNSSGEDVSRIAVLKSYVYDFNNIEISTIKYNIVIYN